MAFSERMQAKLDTNRRLLLARAENDTENERLQKLQQEEEQRERRELLFDVNEAARRAREGRIRTNVMVNLGDVALTGWRISQHDLHDKVKVDYGRIRDVVSGGYDHSGVEFVDRVVGTNELIIEQRGELWCVHHNAYRVGAHPPTILTANVINARQFTDQDFAQWSPSIVAQTVLNFIENNHLDQAHDSAN
jgi:hypothetical protein